MQYVTRKQLGVYTSPEEACNALDTAQMERLSESYKDYQINQIIVDALSPFKVKIQANSNTDGEVIMPEDYQHLLGSVYTTYGGTINPVHFVNEDEISDALTSQLRPVTLSTPIALDSALGFQLYPQTTQAVSYTYLRRPNKPVLSYTQTGRNIVYDPIGSVQIEFYDIYVNDIIYRALKFLGVNMDEQSVEQFAFMQQQQNT